MTARKVRGRAVPLLVAVLAAACASAPPRPPEAHPRLFVTPERLAAVRAEVRIPGSTHREAFEAMKARVDAGDWRVYAEEFSGGGYAPGGNWNYYRAYLAREAAMMYLLTGERHYAQEAFDALWAVHHDPGPDKRLPETNYGLSRATVGMGFAIAYDWAYAGLTPEQREYLRSKIVTALDAWPQYHHANIETEHQGSNWVAVTRGGELVEMLATYEDRDRPERFDFLKRSLHQHMETAYGPSGWSQEGIGYTSYAGQFLLPAALALRSIGDPALEDQLRRIEWWRLLMAVGSFTPEQYHLMSGVDGGFGSDNQGWTSLVLATVPPAEAPYYRFFYDRHMGKDLPVPPARKYDWRRAGTTWALLYYPENVPAADPDGHVPRTLFDAEKGVYFFRNRWQNADDVLASIMGDYDYHGNAWDVPEAFQLGLIAYGTPFAGGPGKEATGKDAKHDGFSSLLVDGRAFPASGRTGAPVFAAADSSGGGYVIVGGGEKYAGLGLSHAERHLLVDFHEGALLSTLDRVRADSAHTYTWQLDPGGPHREGAVRVITGTDAGRPSFTIRGEDGSYARGWVLAPAGARVVSASPLRVEVRAASADVWVAMVTGRGSPPSAQIAGEGLGSTVVVAGRRLRYDPAAGRLVAEAAAASSARRDGRSYYVDARRGDDANPGTSPRRPWRSLERVNAHVFQPGDSILLRAGTRYTGHLEPKGSGAPGRPIVLGRYGKGARPRIDGEGRHPETLLLHNVEQWEVADLEITNNGATRQAGRAGVRVKLEDFGTAHHIWVERLFVHDVNGSVVKKEGGGSGITADNGGTRVRSRFDDLLIAENELLRVDRDGIATRSAYMQRDSTWFPSLHVVIRGNRLEDFGGDGIVVRGTDGALIERNVLKDGHMRGDDYAAGIWPVASDNTVVQFNEVSGLRGTKDSMAYDSDIRTRNTLFQYNYSHDNEGGFFMVCGGETNTGTVFRYNISQNDRHRIFYLTGAMPGIEIYNNTIYVGPGLDVWAIWPGGGQSGYARNVRFANNLFQIDGRGRYNLGGLDIRFEGNAFPGNHLDLPSAARTVTGDPRLAAPGTGGSGLASLAGYRLKPGSACIDAGVPVAVTASRDFWGNPVPAGAAPDCGASEYVGVSRASHPSTDSPAP